MVKGSIMPMGKGAMGKGAYAAAAYQGVGQKQQKAVSPEALEMQFNETAGNLFDRLMDFNQPTVALEKGWRDVLQLRDRLKQQLLQWQQRQQPAPKAAGGGQGADGKGETNWKGELYSELNKRLGRGVTKEDISFEVTEAEGGWLAHLSCPSCLKNDYQGDEVMPSKKGAEARAAKVALEFEFPQTFRSLCGYAPAQGNANSNANSKKRKAADLSERMAEQPANNGEFKCRLSQAAQLLQGRPLEKGEIVYETVPAEGEPEGTFVGTVTLVGYDSTTGYQGFPTFGKKNAETAAAEAALVALADQIAPLEEERKAAKKAKAKEALAEFKTRLNGAKTMDGAKAVVKKE